jgi:hypothetical protein
MGLYSDARMEAFREATGIRPLEGEAAKFVIGLQSKCLETALMLENELSGIRDGNGNWQGCDVIASLCEDLEEAVEHVWRGRIRDVDDMNMRIFESGERIRRMARDAGLLPEAV